MHTPEDVDYRRGYETWLLREAKNRSVSIPTYCLSWTTPYWVGNGTVSNERRDPDPDPAYVGWK